MTAATSPERHPRVHHASIKATARQASFLLQDGRHHDGLEYLIHAVEAQAISEGIKGAHLRPRGAVA